MAKDKKKSLGIKTTRYFTKTCLNCNFEYPNWFTNCPKCGIAWDFVEAEKTSGTKDALKKTIKIIVKITEEDFDEALERVQLNFSADQGISWYQMEMISKTDYFVAELADVPTGSTIIYFIEVRLKNGEIIVENNDGNYYYYIVGSPYEDTSSSSINSKKIENQEISKKVEIPEKPKKQEVITRPIKQEYFKPKTETPKMPHRVSKIQTPQNLKDYRAEDNITIFGNPQTEIDPDLKLCPHCNSKIKKMWNTCPICGK
ncbi:MAG: hypothetical protein KGD73_00240 [Candidatus Lokiarchaeota archaeon]|nr:hypothetical protein [Candidatus Lokiarchaeota archaeon]